MILPLDLPEIRAHLIQFLTRHQLTVCARVSRDWNESFEPSIWTRLVIEQDLIMQPASNVSRKALCRHAKSIQLLSCHSTDNLYLQDIHFPNLHALVLAPPLNQDLSFIHHHQNTLTSLSLRCTRSPNNTSQEFLQMWVAIASCPSLISLTVCDTRVTTTCLPMFWSLWRRLVCLRLFQVHLGEVVSCLSAVDMDSPSSRMGKEQTPMLLPSESLKVLSLKLHGLYTVKDQLAVLRFCPALESIAWFASQVIDLDGQGEALAEYTRFCPNLTDIDIGLHTVKEDSILPFLESRKSTLLKRLTVTTGWIGFASARLLREKYCTTLQSLDLLNAPLIEGSIVQDMMCSLTGLTSFSARMIHGRSIIQDPRPWVCLNLIQLTLGFEISSGVERQILVRIGTLHRLVHLELQGLTLASLRPNERGYQSIDVGLEAGLDCLVNMRRLEVLSLGDTSQTLAEEDIMWMVRTWRQLRVVRAKLHPDPTMDISLRQILETHNVVQHTSPTSIAIVD